MVGRWCPLPVPPFTFIAPRGFAAHRLAHLLDSLVRVSRRVDGQASAGAMSLQFCTSSDPPQHARLRRGAAQPRDLQPRVPAPASARVGYRLHESALPGRNTPGHPFPLYNFMHSFTRLPAVFSSFPRGTFLLSVSHRYLALDGVYHPIGAAFPNNPTLRVHSVKGYARPTGLSPSVAICSKMLRPRCAQEVPLQTTIRQQAGDLHTGLLPFRSPLLGESRLVSFPPLIDMLKFSGCPCLNSGRESWLLLRSCCCCLSSKHTPSCILFAPTMMEAVAWLHRNPALRHCHRRRQQRYVVIPDLQLS